MRGGFSMKLDNYGATVRAAVIGYGCRGKTQMEVAEEISISQAQVSRLEKNALKYMRKYV